ncbi:MAG: hypothetical protein M1531_02075 [Chloroflexi bacterium]|nr:hypothetical protein [Chloroflexota bacterium]
MTKWSWGSMTEFHLGNTYIWMSLGKYEEWFVWVLWVMAATLGLVVATWAIGRVSRPLGLLFIWLDAVAQRLVRLSLLVAGLVWASVGVIYLLHHLTGYPQLH